MSQEFHYDGPMHRPWEGEPSFQEVLAEQLKKAPWLLISLAGHILVGAFFVLLSRLEPDEPPPPPPPPISAATQTEDQIEETPPEEQPQEEQVTEEVTEVTEVQTDNEMETAEEQGEEGESESYEGGDFNFEGAGMGGGRGGKRGGRFGGGKKASGGGGAGTENSVEDGLRWLKNHQDEDGKWDSDEFDRHCEGAPCTGAGSSSHNVGLTGLALLAFLGDGHHPNRKTPYQRVVRNGVNWLVENMGEGEDDGLIGGRSGHAFMYDHAIAALALCEAYLLSQQENLRGPAQRAVNFVLRARNPYKAWRYEAPPNGENDSSVTGWMVFVLKTAQDAGLDIDKAAYEGATSLFDELTDSATGRCGYINRGEPPARPTGKAEKWPAANSESLTAVALLCRIFMGETPKTNPLLDAHAELMLSKLPAWKGEDVTTVDMYYWYYGAFAMFQMGGKYWEKWNGAMKPALVATQRKDGHFKGSWDPVDPWGEDGGRIYSTAICVLCLEVYYRYGQVMDKGGAAPGGPQKPK
ncbi:MAG: terpene cyclase/mutase family protein [Planctomycetes bacterium]|nr:terpene cyclase/mutase family protein [Planctomycetota bacterium]